MDYRVLKIILNPTDIFRLLHLEDITHDKCPYTYSIYTKLVDMFSHIALARHTWSPRRIRSSIKLNCGVVFDDYDDINYTEPKHIDRVLTDWYNVVQEDIVDEYLTKMYKLFAREFMRSDDFGEYISNNANMINMLKIDHMAIAEEAYDALPSCLKDKYGDRRWMVMLVLDKFIYYIDTILSEFKKVINGGNNMGKTWLEKRVPVYGNTDAEQLREAVNSFDKLCGCRLKHPEDIPEGKSGYREMIFSVKGYFSKLILALNKMNSDDYISYSKIFGDTLKKIKINDEFKDNSAWFDDESHSVTNLAYKSRFLTYLTNWIIKNLDEIVDKLYVLDDKGDLLKYDYKIEYVQTVASRLALLFERMLSGQGDYKSLMIYFFDLQAYVEGDIRGIKQQEKKITDIHDQTFILSQRLKLFSQADNDITMDTLIKLAYLAATNETKVKNVFKFYNGYKFYDTATTREIISHLGKKILASYNRDKKIPKMFKFFIKADPLVYSKWEDVNSDKRLLVGTIALKYYAFMTNDKRIIRKVNSLIGD